MLSAMRGPIQAAATAHGCKMLKKEREAILHNPRLASPLKGVRAAAQVPTLGREGKGGGLESLSIPSPN